MSLEEGKICIKCKEYKLLELFVKTKSCKHGRRNTCKECSRIYMRTYEKRPNAKKRHVKWASNNPDKVKAKMEKWEKNNPEKVAANCARRRLIFIDANMPWTNHAKIKEMAFERDRLTEETGIKHHLDHIIPLNHELVMGLHVENNLQILTESENCSKSNKFNPEDFFDWTPRLFIGIDI
jgi:hypothetical protein